MKVAIKIFILLLAVVLAVGGIMIYAKTKVDPPVNLDPVDQFDIDLAQCNVAIVKGESEKEIDYKYISTLERIKVYQQEKKIQSSVADKSLDNLAVTYSPLFLKRCFTAFQNVSWSDDDHADMLLRIRGLKDLKHSNGTPVLLKSTSDSLDQVSRIIADYKQARIVSRSNSFTGISNAKSTINQATQYANDQYLSNCLDLVSALNSVKKNIAESHYNYIFSQVAELSQYRYFSKDFYVNTLIPHVDKVVSEYDNEAGALYGSKRDVDLLWSRVRNYYDQAMLYYQPLNYSSRKSEGNLLNKHEYSNTVYQYSTLYRSPSLQSPKIKLIENTTVEIIEHVNEQFLKVKADNQIGYLWVGSLK